MAKIKYTWLFILSLVAVAAGPTIMFYPAIVICFICLMKLFV